MSEGFTLKASLGHIRIVYKTDGGGAVEGVFARRCASKARVELLRDGKPTPSREANTANVVLVGRFGK